MAFPHSQAIQHGLANHKPIQDQVIVITGASSGIGLCTAKMAAEKGANVVLASRNGEDLSNITRSIKARGGKAAFCVADVANVEDMQKIADTALKKFGRIDTWVNNAGISIYGRLTEVHMADKRRLFDVNFWGTVNGCKVAVQNMRETGGTIINIGSVVSERAIPLQGIYSASKHAVKAYTDSLRMELEEEEIPISVSLIKPTSIDTMFTEHAKNYMEAQPKLPGPVYHPEVVARAILSCAEKPQRDLIAGGAGLMFSFLEKFTPRLADLFMEKTMFQLQKKAEAPHGRDSLHQATRKDGQIQGDHPGPVLKSSLYTQLVSSLGPKAGPLLAPALLTSVAGFCAYLFLKPGNGKFKGSENGLNPAFDIKADSLARTDQDRMAA